MANVTQLRFSSNRFSTYIVISENDKMAPVERPGHRP